VQTLLTHVDPVPVYANGVFKNKNTRDLRFLDAQKALKAIKSGKTPTCMTAWNVRELRSLMHFYDYVMFNLK
jgi:hypothetical protein